jgi:hypothetical protein
MAQDIKFKIGADTSELEKAFGSLIRKIQNDADKLKLSPAASRASPTTQANTDRELAKNKTFTDAQAKSYQNILKSLKEEYSLLQQIGREREKQNRQEHIANIQKSNFTQFQRAPGWGIRGGVQGGGTPPPGGGGPGVPPPTGGAGEPPFGKGGITSLSGLGSALGVPAMAIGAIATGIVAALTGEKIRTYFAQAENRARVGEASAFNTQGQAGQLLSSAFSGNGLENIMFSSQREQASQIAQQTFNANIKSPFRAFTHPEEWLQNLGLTTDAQTREVRTSQAKEQADIQAEQEDAIRNGPSGRIRTDVSNKYLRDWRRNLDFQRQTGQSEAGFRNFLGGVNSAGFGDEQGMGMSSAILGAGGSTRAATGSAAFALQMGRQFDLTNAGQAMGSISGQLGSSQLSKDALIAVQAEGTRIGVNRSDMREENRKFVEMASSVIGQSNVSSGAGVDQLMEMFARSMSGATTISGLEAGKSAYEAYQSQSNIQSGPSAAMRDAGMRDDAILGQLNERDRAKLSLMPESEITTDSNEIQAMARKSGIKTKDIVKNYHGVISKSLFVNPTTDAAIDKLRKAQGNFAISPGYLNSLEGEAAGEIRLEQAGAGMNEKQLTQYARAQASGDFKGMEALRDDIKNQAGSGGSPRPGDEAEKQQAQASRMANELFMSIQNDIQATATQTAIFTANINALVAAMKGGDPASIAAAQNNLYNFGSQTQQPQDVTHAGTGGPPTSSAQDIKNWQNSHP